MQEGFLWVGFYLDLAGPTIGYASVSVCLWGLLLAGFLCFALYYYVPAMLGMETGHSLYVVGTSTFGTIGGYLMPGLLMGALQVGWVAVISSVAATFIMKGLNQTFPRLVLSYCFGLDLWPGLGCQQGRSLCREGSQVFELGSTDNDPYRFLG